MTDCFQADRLPESLSRNDRPQTKLFQAISGELLREGNSIRFQARGASMSPAICDGEIVHVKPAVLAELRKGDIVLVNGEMGFRLHRLVVADAQQDVFITRGDCGQEDDPAVSGAEIVGLAVAKEVQVGRRFVCARLKGISGRLLYGMARGQRVATKLFYRGRASTIRARRNRRVHPGVLGLLFVLLAATLSTAQVVVDATTSSLATYTTTGNHTLTFAHTTTATANRVLLVGVSMNIAAVTGTTVTGVTYNGTALTRVGAHNDAGNTRRVEMWSLTAPVSGTPNVAVTVNLPTAGSVGVVAGATTFTGVDQTVPLGTFVSADGAAGTCTGIATGCSAVDVPSVVNGMILDTLATGGNQTVTVSGPQVSRWNTNSSGNANPGVRGSGSSRTGAPSVPISETFSGTSNWSLGAVSINPSTADIGVTTSVSAVPLGQNSTYDIKIFNNGLSAANNVVLTDTLATGLTLVSVTPSAGTTCTGTGPITCTLPTSFASGATATVAVVVNAATAGFYPNTATLADSGTPPDPNTGNNSYVALAPVVSVVCSGATLSAGGTLSGVVNTYYPGTASVVKGATSVPVGTATGAGGTIAAGSLLLVVQMQDASINTSNSVSYGNGSTGTGFTTINNAGNYEFVTATGAITGGSVPITGAGPGGGLVFGYTAAAASGTKGVSTYQVVLVPQYLSATLGAVTALGVERINGWNSRARYCRAIELGWSDGIG